MMLKGMHWGYTRFYLNPFFKPLDYTEDEFIRRFHPDSAVLLKPKVLTNTDATKEGDRLALCPVGPALRAMGLGKKPLGHPTILSSSVLNT